MTYELTPADEARLTNSTHHLCLDDAEVNEIRWTIQRIVTEALATQREGIANAIEHAPPGDRIAHMYFAEGIRSAARIAREYCTKDGA